jgi:hypothetical protein
MPPQSPPVSDITLSLALALVSASTAPLLLLDSDLTVIAASTSFCNAFQIDGTTVSGTPLAALGAGEWNIPRVTGLLKATASGFAEIESYETDLIRQGQPPAAWC